MNYITLVIFLVVVVGLIAFSARARRRQAEAEEVRREHIQLGAEVMTTSGLYGTVVRLDEDEETVQLSIAPGVEVKWALAALRGIADLPERYARGAGQDAPPLAGPLSRPSLRKEPGLS